MLKRQESNATNQTEFVDQAQFLEKSATNLLNLHDLKKNRNLLPFIILGGFILLFLLLLILSVFAKKNVQEVEEVKKTQVETETDPLKLRVTELKEDLQNHNPTKQTLPFPEVDLEFNIN
jgi:hypothetical protein